MDIQAPTAQALTRGVQCASAPCHACHSVTSWRARLVREGHTRESRERLRKLRGLLVDRAVDIADTRGDALLARHRAAIGISTVPGEGGMLIRRGRELLREALPGNEHFQLDAQESGRHGGCC